MRYRNAVFAEQSSRRILSIVAILEFVIIAYMWFGWYSAPTNLRITIPPDIRNGATIRPSEVDAANMYQFALHIYQQLNRWQTDGETDYPKNIYRLQAFLTEKYKNELLTRASEKKKLGELQRRTRTVQQLADHMYEPKLVKYIGNGVWGVEIQLLLEEYHNQTGMKIKEVKLLAPLRIVESNVDAEKNPWGWLLDGDSGSIRIQESES